MSLLIVARDFNGLLIPSSLPVLIVAGTSVEITQNKGGFATIYANGNLIRVEQRDLDAIGLAKKREPINNTIIDVYPRPLKIITGPANIGSAWQALRECYDPEIPVNIVDLGLIYSCEIKENKVIVTMTLTAPMCGMGPVLVSDIKHKLLELENIIEVDVEMVFDPPWTSDRMSDVAKMELGLI